MIIKKAYFRHFYISLFSFIGIVALATDQVLKYKIRLNGGFYVCNPGISFGFILPDIVFWLSMVTFLILLLFYFFNSLKNTFFSLLLFFGLVLLLSGAISNILDRIFFNCVFDYIKIFPEIFPVFNLADVTISTGSFMVIYNFLKKNTEFSV